MGTARRLCGTVRCVHIDDLEGEKSETVNTPSVSSLTSKSAFSPLYLRKTIRSDKFAGYTVVFFTAELSLFTRELLEIGERSDKAPNASQREEGEGG